MPDRCYRNQSPVFLVAHSIFNETAFRAEPKIVSVGMLPLRILIGNIYGCLIVPGIDFRTGTRFVLNIETVFWDLKRCQFGDIVRLLAWCSWFWLINHMTLSSIFVDRACSTVCSLHSSICQNVHHHLNKLMRRIPW